MARRALALLAAFAALTAAGCGGADQLSRAEYNKRLLVIGKSLSARLNSVDARITAAKDAGDLGTEATAASKALREVADQIDELAAPDDAKVANQQLAGGLKAWADAFDQVGKEARNTGTSSDSKGLGDAVAGLGRSEGLRQTKAAVGDLKAKGYNFSN